VPKALLQDLRSPNATVDVSEIEPSLPHLAQTYFGLPNTNKLHHFNEDGRRLLTQHPKQYDLIFSDVYYSLYSIPAHFTTREFFELSRSRLNAHGVFIANVIGSLNQFNRQQPSFLLSEIKTFQAAFPNSYFFAVNSPTSTKPQNIIFVGYNGNGAQSADANLSPEHLAHFDDPILRGLAQHRIDTTQLDLANRPLFSDNYAPVEDFIAPTLRQLAHR
jgi:spermidine synthase